MRRLLLLLVASSYFSAPAFALQQFTTASQAQQHCPNDTVVWLNLRTMMWHEKGKRWYGITKYGAYVCEKDAAAAGARPPPNGK
jgi:hypothetical protein